MRASRKLAHWFGRRPPNELAARGDAVRLVATLVVLPFVWMTDAPGSTQALVSAALVVHQVSASLLERYGDRHPTFPTVAVTGPIGAATAFSFSFLNDSMRVGALFGYVILIGFMAATATRRVAIALAGLAAALGIGRELLVEPAERLPSFALFMFAGCLVVLTVFIEALKNEAELSTRMLTRVHAAMRSVTTDPDFDETLDSIVDAAAQAAHGSGTAVLLLEGDHLVLAAPSAMRQTWSDDHVARHTAVELRDGVVSPLAITCATGQTVVVPDLANEDRFPVWSAKFGRMLSMYNVHAIVFVPLLMGGEVVGAMQTLFRGPIPSPRETIPLLEAYAEQATVVIVRAQAYEQERRANERLETADRMKSDFLALVSHELRTPLTATKGFVDTVLYQWDRLDDEHRRDLLGRASRNAGELTRLIDTLLEYSRLEAGPALDLRTLSLADAVEHVLEHCAPALGDHPVHVDVAEDLYVRADVNAIGHMLENLLMNAAKYAPAASPITIGAGAEEGEVLAWVADTGPGIPLSEQDLIFERFYRSPEHRRGPRGTGLGLTIARRAAVAQGGRLWVESEPGHGATFVFTLPAAPAPPAGGLTADPAADRLDQPV